MRFDGDASEIVLSSGRRFYAHANILGLSDNAQESYGITHGYDGGVQDDDFTDAERVEIAAEMIGRWERWRDRRVS